MADIQKALRMEEEAMKEMKRNMVSMYNTGTYISSCVMHRLVY